MERKEVDTQQFIDHSLLATELMDLIDHTSVFPKNEGPTNLTTSGNTASGSADYSDKDALSPELNFHNTIFQFVNKHVVDDNSARPAVVRAPERVENYSNSKETDVEFLSLNSSFDNDVPVPQVAQPQPAFPALAIEPTVPIDVSAALEDDEMLYAHSVSTTNARKVLPHKKRISRKLKGTLANIEATSGFDLEQNNHVQVAAANAALYTCEICGYAVHTQLEFFAHLKQHYEPTVLEQRLDVPQQQKEPLDMCGLTSQDKLQQEQAKLDQVFQDVQLSFENFHNIAKTLNPHEDDIYAEAMSRHKLPSPHVIEEKLAPVVANVTPYVPTVTERALKSAVNDVPVVDDIEFSDSEDMLEGIRNVVDKVSIEDTCDELDLELTSSAMRAPWFNNNFSDIPFSGPLSQLLLPGEPPPPALREGTVPLIKPITNNTDQLTLNFLNAEKPTEQSLEKLDVPLEKKDYNDGVTEQTLLVSSPRSTTPTTSSAIEQMQRSPLIINDGFKLENVDEETAETNEANDDGDDCYAVESTTVSQDDFDENFLLETDDIVENEKTEDNDKTEEKTKSHKLFHCEICVKDFNSYNALKYHNLRHNEERCYQCGTCGRSFYTKSARKSHERSHSGERPFSCDICNARFRQLGDIKFHIIAKHTDIKAYMCEFCGKAFSRKYSLVVHRRIHTNERNYICSFCSMSFRASSYLLDHIKSHTGEKPHSCSQCDKRFRVSGGLKRHMRIHLRKEGATQANKKKHNSNKNKAQRLDEIKSTKTEEQSEQEILGS